MRKRRLVLTGMILREQFLPILSRFWAWFFLFILISFFSFTGRGFFSLFNFQSMITNAAMSLIMALGQTFVIISGGIDLSVGYVMGLASVVTAMTINTLNGLPIPPPLPATLLCAILAGILVGMLAGTVNGLLVAWLRVPPFIVTLGMLGIARGAAFLLSGGLPVSVQVPGVGDLGNGNLFYYHQVSGFSFLNSPTDLTTLQRRDLISILPFPLIFVILLFLVCMLILRYSRFGRHTYAIGGNTEAASRAGIPVMRHTIMLYVISAGMAALAGIVYTFRFTNGEAIAGDALLLDSIAAVVIGGASLFGGEGTMTGTFIGILIITVLSNGLVMLNINGFWQFVAVGIVIILAVLVDQLKARFAH